MIESWLSYAIRGILPHVNGEAAVAMDAGGGELAPYLAKVWGNGRQWLDVSDVGDEDDANGRMLLSWCDL